MTSCTVSNESLTIAHRHGVIIHVTPACLSYMANKAWAVCAKTGATIVKDNVVYVTSWLVKRGFPIVRSTYKNKYDRTNM